MPPTSPLEKWDGIKVAMQFRPVCPQKLPDLAKLEKNLPLGRVDHYKRILPFLVRQAEECLNLNIYVPVRGESDINIQYMF
jgi:neuroligin